MERPMGHTANRRWSHLTVFDQDTTLQLHLPHQLRKLFAETCKVLIITHLREIHTQHVQTRRLQTIP